MVAADDHAADVDSDRSTPRAETWALMSKGRPIPRE